MIESKTEVFEAQPDFVSRVQLEKSTKIAKVMLNEDAFEFYEISSLTVPKGTKEAKELEKFNKNYAFITTAAGRRKTSNAETQTDNPLLKTRSVNCAVSSVKDEKSNVSNYDIFVTNQEVAGENKLLGAGDAEVAETSSRELVKNWEELIADNENFHVAAMILERFCAENVFRSKQKRIFNLTPLDPLNIDSAITYRLEKLWSYHCFETMGKEVVGMSWCPNQHGVLAVAYGTYQYRDSKHRISGAVLIWNCKNPVNPERRYHYKQPVTAIEFCENSPQYLAVGLYDGSVEIIDITPIMEKVVVAKSERKSSPGIEPVWQIKWIKEKDDDLMLTVGQDGRVMKLKMGSGPHLIGLPQVHLNRVDGVVEALPVEHNKTFSEGDHHSQGLCLQTHPLKEEIYLVGSDEGCVHICSTKFTDQHTGVFQGHNGGVYSIEYSPFSSKVFLTAGGDWMVRIWIEGIFEPIFELSNGFSAIHSAYWSPTNPTVIAACTQESVCVWELLRKNPKPVTVKAFGSEQLTVFKFSPCGRSIVVGDNEGNTHVVALEEFPFPPRYPFKQLEKVILNMVGEKLHLKQQIMNIGGLGYSKDKKIKK